MSSVDKKSSSSSSSARSNKDSSFVDCDNQNIHSSTINGTGTGTGTDHGIDHGIESDNNNDESNSYEDESSGDNLSSTDGSSHASLRRSSSTVRNKEKRNAREDMLVIRSKALVIVALMIAGGVVAGATYRFTKRDEQQDFETRFKDYGNQVIEVSQINAKHVFETFQSLSLSITTYAKGTRSEWPFVTMPYFETLGSTAIDQASADFIGIAHLVAPETRQQWESYAVANQWWVQEGLDIQNAGTNKVVNASNIIPYIYQWNEPSSPGGRPSLGEAHLENSQEFFAPLWQTSPVTELPFFTNFNTYNYGFFLRVFQGMVEAGQAVLSEAINLPSDFSDGSDGTNDIAVTGNFNSSANWPTSFMSAPIYDKPNKGGKLVAFIVSFLPWHRYFQGLLPENVEGMYLVVDNTCGQSFTYEIFGPDVTYLGPDDYHEPEYDDLVVHSDFDSTFISIKECLFSFHVYPTSEFRKAYKTNGPIVYTTGVVFIFLLTIIFFFVYDMFVEQRQGKVVTSAARSDAIVNSLFPANVRDRLMEDAETALDNKKKQHSTLDGQNGRHAFHLYGSATTNTNITLQNQTDVRESKPIADLFPNCTVLFADIAGFTSWSSEREPAQVFILLETLYNSFDKIAKRLRIFKVETIGDCYVAVAGLPDPREDHAVAMARFARDCLSKMTQVVHKLEVTLGPDTGDLSIRVGLHSGPVTAGVLRGDKGRFQLFGDTVNTAARMESTGVRNRIHVSQETADLLVAAGKSQWIESHEAVVFAKGKGKLKTFFLVFSPTVVEPGLISHDTNSFSDGSDKVDNISTPKVAGESSDAAAKSPDGDDSEEFVVTNCVRLDGDVMVGSTREERLISWNLDVLLRLLKSVVAKRQSIHPAEKQQQNQEQRQQSFEESYNDKISGTMVLEEVQEIIALDDTSNNNNNNNNVLEGHGQRQIMIIDPASVELSKEVEDQMRNYIETVASMYHDNPFHSFDHASHVIQSVTKLLSRIVTADTIDYSNMVYTHQSGGGLHEYSFGITKDPLIPFACAFSALIHDLDHGGVPNAVLVKEQTEVAMAYKNKSVAEQNSVDLAWDLLMEPRYKELRGCIYTTSQEFTRFRQLVVNSVMATDIVDKELGLLRRNRWDKAFACADEIQVEHQDESPKLARDRKATIVVEHLIQASDISHTMQHWHVYLKWNERLYHEMYKAYLAGRLATDPSEKWYEGELGFYDFYIIPLARKLKECGVFGVSSDEYLNYALANRNEWHSKGQSVVKGYVRKYGKKSTVVGVTSGAVA